MRFQWIQAHQNKADEDWKNVACSDEMRFLAVALNMNLQTKRALCQQSRLLVVL